MQRDRKDRLMRRKTLEHQVPPFMCLCMCWLNEPLYAAFGLFRGTSAQPSMRALSKLMRQLFLRVQGVHGCLRKVSCVLVSADTHG